MPDTPRQLYPLDHASHLPVLIGIGMKSRIRRVLEIGSGPYSTPLFLNLEVFPDLTELVSVEPNAEWAQKARSYGRRDSRINHRQSSRHGFVFGDGVTVYRILRGLAGTLGQLRCIIDDP